MAAALAAAALAPGESRAQALDGEFTVQRFNPAPGPRNFFTTRGARVDGEMAWSAGAFANYAYQPFVLRSCISQTNCDDPNAIQAEDVPVVENMVTADVLASFTIFPALQLGLRIPITWVDGQGLTEQGTPDLANGLSATGVGDAELEGKYRFYGESTDTMVLAGALFVTGPLGQATAEGGYVGDKSPNVGARVIFDGKEGPLSFGFNLGGLWRESARVGSTELGPEMRYNIAAGYALSEGFRLVLDGFGSTKFASQNGTNALEADAGVQIMPSGATTISAGAGTGLIQGVGVPSVRAFVGFLYTAENIDTDGDGVVDSEDRNADGSCKTVPEDKDGHEDSDGCPDPDNDGDSIPDAKDKCANESEDSDGFEDVDGCPEPDNDKDGVPDYNDRCSEEPETKNGFKDEDGCPDEADTDSDGVPDSRDTCKDAPEDTDGFEDTDGCPDPDNDKDTVPDNGDECIDEPETINGFKDEDGCPDEAPKTQGKQMVKVTAEGIEILERVEFATNSAKIVGKKSFQVLDAVVEVLKTNPRIRSVEVQGHTDNAGNPDKNKTLSQKRAEAVRDYLVSKGIAADRLSAAGYGQEKPIADNTTADGKQQNRRVEFKILKRE